MAAGPIKTDTPEGEVVPAWPIAESDCPVVTNAWVNEEYKHLVLDAPHGAANAEAGQFFHLLCPTRDQRAPFLRRPMSIYRIDRGGQRLEFLYKIVGTGTATLAELKPGESLNIFGPLGTGFGFDDSCRHVVQIARGVGLATLAPVAEAAAAIGVRVTAILSARQPEFVMSVDHLQAMGATVIQVTDADGSSDVDKVEATIRTLVEKENADFLVTCGSNRLLQLAQALGREYGIRGEVALEQRMGCGIGMCFACVRAFRTPDGGETYRRVCWDGPVFDIQEAISW